jgi:hypothetical protein
MVFWDVTPCSLVDREALPTLRRILEPPPSTMKMEGAGPSDTSVTLHKIMKRQIPKKMHEHVIYLHGKLKPHDMQLSIQVNGHRYSLYEFMYSQNINCA